MLNVAEFLRDAGTMYLLGAADAIVAPLVASLPAEIARTPAGSPATWARAWTRP